MHSIQIRLGVKWCNAVWNLYLSECEDRGVRILDQTRRIHDYSMFGVVSKSGQRLRFQTL